MISRGCSERISNLHAEFGSHKLEGAAATLSFSNGHLVRLLPNGYVMQSKSHIQKDFALNPEKEHPENEEECRIVVGKSLIRYLINGEIEILFANGNLSKYDPKN
jgi:hypothetical protein